MRGTQQRGEDHLVRLGFLASSTCILRCELLQDERKGEGHKTQGRLRNESQIQHLYLSDTAAERSIALGNQS